MISVWNNASQYDPKKARPSTWIFTIGRNKKIDLIRKQKRQELDPNDPFFVPDVKEDETGDAMDLEVQAGRLRRAIQDLPVEQAELIKKSYFEDKAHGDIARETRLPLGTVKSRLRLAMERLRREFEHDLKDQGN